MTTPDGISEDDWSRVRELAVEIVNASEDAEEQALRQRLLTCLDHLEQKYGQRPSILATRADYIDKEDVAERLVLLHRAYTLSLAHQDSRNLLYTASSLAELYVKERRDPTEGRRWLGIATDLLSRTGDSSDADELNELAAALDEMEE